MNDQSRLPMVRVRPDPLAPLLAELTALRARVDRLERALEGGEVTAERGAAPGHGLRDIAAAIAHQHDLQLVDLLSEARGHRISHPRQEFMAAASTAGFTVGRIARFLGCDHSTVSHGIRAAQQRHKTGGKND